jgi:CheY-like chemotaxis protein
VETAVPDLLVLDVMLPKLDGWAVCRRIRENEATRLLPVVMLTSRGDEMDRVLGLELGVIGVWLLRALGKTPVVVSWQAVGLSVVFSVAVGILFGVYPARRAAWISPVEALRTE